MTCLSNGKIIDVFQNKPESTYRPSRDWEDDQRKESSRYNPLRSPMPLSGYPAEHKPLQRNMTFSLTRNSSSKGLFSVAAFVDYENLSSSCRNTRGVSVDFKGFRNYLASESEHRSPMEFFCYVAIDPYDSSAKNAEIQQLEAAGWIVRTKMGMYNVNGEFKCYFDIEMAIDIALFAGETKPDIIVLTTGTKRLAPLVVKLRERNVRCEVAAFPNNISLALLNAASGFINLEKYFFEREQNNESYKNLSSDVDDYDENEYSDYIPKSRDNRAQTWRDLSARA